MAGYDDAVFISYTHIDNEPFGPEQLRWVSHLHDQLTSRVQQLLGEQVSVWRDDKLHGNDVFADALVDRLADVAVLVSVCSPRYVKSEWCRRELDVFVDAAHRTGGLQAGTRSRVFKVLKTPVLLDDLPDPLQPVLGYEFFEEDAEQRRSREYLLNPDPQQRWKFYARVDDLAQDIAELLEDLATTATTAADASDGRAVFLAETTSDVTAERDRLKRELERRGHRVLPTRTLPLKAADLASAVGTDLRKCALSVHLLGARYGVRPEGDDRSLAHLQLDVATQQAGRNGLAQLIWMPDEIDSPDDAQAALLAQLHTGILDAKAELVRAPLETFKSYVLERLAPPPPPAVTANPAGPTARVYLMCDRPDREGAAPLRSLLESLGHAVMTPLAEGTEAEAREVHEASLVLSDAVLIYYGEATEHWVRMKLFDLLKAPGWGRTAPFRAKAVFVAPPRTPAKESFATAEAVVLRADDGEPALAPFLAELAAVAAPGP